MLSVALIFQLMRINVSHTHTETHNHFAAILDHVWDYPDEPAAER